MRLMRLVDPWANLKLTLAVAKCLMVTPKIVCPSTRFDRHAHCPHHPLTTVTQTQGKREQRKAPFPNLVLFLTTGF